MEKELQKVGQRGFLKGMAQGIPGIEGVDDRDRRRGNIILVQENSKFFRSKGHEPGTFVNTATERKVEDTTFIPAYLTKYFDAYEWMAGRAKWLFRTIEEHDERLQGKRWRQEGNEKSEVVPVLALVAILEGQPVQIAFKKLSGYPAGQKLYSFAKDRAEKEGIPLYGYQYTLVAREGHNKAGDEFWSIDIEDAGKTSEEDYQRAKELSEGLSGRRSEVAKEASAEDHDVPF